MRILFRNLLPIGVEGNLFIPVDTTVMGSGMGPLAMNGTAMETDPLNPMCGMARHQAESRIATLRTAPRCTCTAASAPGSATARRTSGSPRPARTPLIPRASACRMCLTCPTRPRRDDLLLHQPAERPPDVLPRPRLGHHPPECLCRRSRGATSSPIATEQKLITAGDPGRRPPSR